VGTVVSGNNLQAAYDLTPGIINLTAAIGPIELRDDPTPIGDLFVVADSAGSQFLAVSSTDSDHGLSSRRVFQTVYGTATGRGGIQAWPDTFTITTAVSPIAFITWSGTMTSAVPGGGGIGNDSFGGMVSATGTFVLSDQGSLFNTGLLFNFGVSVDLEANSGPWYTLVNQPRFRSVTAGAKTVSQHNALRIQPRWGPNSAGTLTQINCSPILFFAIVDGSGGACSVTTLDNMLFSVPSLIGGGTIGTWRGLNFSNIVGPTTIRGIESAMSNGQFIRHTGTAPVQLGGALQLGLSTTYTIEFSRIGTGILRMGAINATNNETLDWNFESTPNNVAITSASTAGINFDTVEIAFGPSTVADGTNNWVFAFSPGLRGTQLAGDYSEVLFTSSSSILVAHAITNFATWTVNAPSISIGGGSITNAANVLVQTNMNQGTNRYGLLVTSSPSGGTLNYCARFTGTAGVRIDGIFEHAGASLGIFGAAPVVQPTALGITAGFTVGAGTGVNDDSTFTGNTGASAYTIGDVVRALKDIGALAA